jgi:hypothetical protein
MRQEDNHKYRVGKNLEGESHGLLQDTNPEFAQRECGTPQKIHQDNQ